MDVTLSKLEAYLCNLTKIVLEKDRAASVKYHHRINLETFIAESKAE